MRASYPIQQRQQKAWKAMFYTLVEIVAVNSFLLSASSYVSEKITSHRAFREGLCTGLLAHEKPISGNIAGVTETVGVTETAGLHQRVKMKRALCVICKQASAEERRGIKGVRRQVLQGLSPNIVSKRSQQRVSRAKTGCSLCKVALYSKRGCWEAFHC